MSLALFQELAAAALIEIARRGCLPILAGGTPLYINAVVEGWRIPRVPPNQELRSRLAAEAEESGIGYLTRRLAKVDSIAAERSRTNLRRIIRGLEVYEATGTPMSQLEGKSSPIFDALEIGLTMPREHLYELIDQRVDEQVALGLLGEAQRLLRSGVSPEAPAFSALGYRQLLPVLSGESTLDAAIERIKFDTHRYVRHQETWLRKNDRIEWFDVTAEGWKERAMARVENFLVS
jgi:tRNA dimethylallyltransferase